MKLKRAVKLARNAGFEWVFVTPAREILGTNGTVGQKINAKTEEPECWVLIDSNPEDLHLIGKYTGKVPWYDSIRNTSECLNCEIVADVVPFHEPQAHNPLAVVLDAILDHARQQHAAPDPQGERPPKACDDPLGR